MHHWQYLATVVASLLAARTAAAKDTGAQEQAAQAACSAGDYARGVAILSELYQATKDPSHIYNQGRCFEQNHRCEDAVARFQEFLRVGRRLRKADKADAEQHIAACQDMLAKQGASPSPVSGSANREAKERAAKKACLNGDPTRGVEILTDLYVDTNDPTYIFNQGRCYEQNNLSEEAIVRFREYLRKTPHASERDRADVTKHIADCEALLAKRGGSTAAPSVAAGVPAPTVDPTPAPFAQAPSATNGVTPAETVAASPQGQARPGAGLRVAGVVTMSAGAAFVITGVAFNLKHNSTIHDLQGDYSVGTADSAEAYKTWSTVGYGAGAACLAGGAVLYWLGHRAGNTVVMPALGAGRTGLLLAGEF
jgi:tetratricopeptide (TPR) repeat protein